MKRLTVLVLAIAVIGSACGSSDDSTDSSTTEATTTSVSGQPEDGAFGVVYVSAGAYDQFPSSNGASVSGSVVSPEMVFVTDSSIFPDDGESNPSDEWTPSPGPGFAEGGALGGEGIESAHGCFVSRDFIFVQAIVDGDSVVDAYDAIERVSEVGDEGYPEADPELGPRVIAYDGRFSESVVHVRVVEGVNTLELVVQLLADGVPAAPEYAISFAPKWKYGPGTLPIEPGPEIPAATDWGYGEVNVIDSFGDNGHSAAAFHGDFISGILLRLGVSPNASDVGIPGSNFATELAVASSVVSGINNISMGGHECGVQEGAFIGDLEIPDLNGDGDTDDLLPLPPIAIPAVLYGDPGDDIPGVDATIVASAGNDATSASPHSETFPARFASLTTLSIKNLPPAVQPYYEAVLPKGDGTVKVWSVGALTGGGKRASFSNYGDNTVWAQGVGIISDYGDGTAVWAGTSFAAPIVAAAIARGEFP